jgi:hypothetical protein
VKADRQVNFHRHFADNFKGQTETRAVVLYLIEDSSGDDSIEFL